MTNPYGPWATTIDAGRNPQLSAFWKRRLGMLVPTSQTSPVLSRRSLLWLGAAGVLTSAIPSFRSTSVVADEEKPDDAGKQHLSGRIFVGADLRLATGNAEYLGYIRIDPETGQWEKVMESRGAGPVRVSPDGQVLPFSKSYLRPNAPQPASPSDWISELWLHNVSTGQSTRVPGFAAGMVCWSPDGTQMVVNEEHFFEAYAKSPLFNPDKRRWVTWLVSLDGIQGTRLPVPDTDAVEDWSTDGKWLVTVSDGLYRMRPDGTERLPLTHEGMNLYARFSTDSKRIVYTRFSRNGNSIHVMNADGTNDREVLRGEGVDDVDSACWSPDGRSLAVLRFKWQVKDGHKVKSGGREDTDYHLELMDVDGNHRHRLDLVGAKAVFLGMPDWR